MTPAKPAAPGLSYEGQLALAWKEVKPPGEMELSELKFANMDVLRTLLSLETYSSEISDELPEVDTQQVARLEFKLNLLLELVGQLLAQQQLIPAVHPLTLTPATVCWQDNVAPTQNSLLRIELYCSMHYPRPLILHGRAVELTHQNAGWLVAAEFEALGETVRDGLERFIFIQHRRAVSRIRRSKHSLF